MSITRTPLRFRTAVAPDDGPGRGGRSAPSARARALLIVGAAALLLAVLAWLLLRPPSGLDRITAAGARTTEEGTARVGVTTLIDAPGSGQQRTQALGVIDFARDRSQLQVRIGLPPATAGGNASTLSLLTITDGPTTYLRSPAWPDGQPWARVVDPEQAAPTAVEEDGVDAGAAATSFDLGGQLALLTAGSADPELLGEETVRNVATTHYRVEVDLAAAIERAEPEDVPPLEQIAAATGSYRFPLELWIDAEDRVRRLRYNLAIPTPGEEDPSDETAAATRYATQVEYFDFGVEVDVTPPELTVDYAVGGPQPEADDGAEDGADEE